MMHYEIGFGSLAATALLAGHVTSAALAWPRSRRDNADSRPVPPIDLTVLRPLCGLETYSEATLRTTFELEAKGIRLLFCVANASDPVVPLVRQIIAEYPNADAQLLIGNEQISANPKLNNLVKGWQQTTSAWVMFVDCNVMLPPDAVAQLLNCWDERCGMVCSPPIGGLCTNLPAELEATFLNGYQARWQRAAARLGLGFAQGKVMFFRRDLLTRVGGLQALASEPAEDAAATKVVRAAGLSVRLVERPFGQPLGSKRLVEVWNRQLRWAQLRRATFPAFFYLEIMTSAVLPLLLLSLDLSGMPALALPLFLSVWYGSELALTARCGWDQPARWLLLALVRDVLIVPIWLTAIWRNKFEWQGHAMSVDDLGVVS